MKNKICVIGDIVVDITLPTIEHGYKLRLGGIVHACRGLWAQNIPYAVGYYAPEYLDKEIETYLKRHGCTEIIKLGNVIGAPYTFLIGEAKEAGSQGYEFLLREAIEIISSPTGFSLLLQKEYSDVLIISGNYNMHEVIKSLNQTTKIHVDVANNINNVFEFGFLERKTETLFISTSSEIFKSSFKHDFESFAKIFEPYTEVIILKENRGGTRSYKFEKEQTIFTASQTRPILHSIGVGDVFDATYVANANELDTEKSLNLSSWLAAEYAITTFPDDFKSQVQRIIQIEPNLLIDIKGVSLPWEVRSTRSIYIAAPDFDYVDTSTIDELVSALEYHNFTARRPIKENGQLTKESSQSDKQNTFFNDMKLLDYCQLLIAVLIYDDPGTLIEIGIAAQKGIPVIVYDPYNKATNCMLTQLPILVSSDMDKIISEVFIQYYKLENK